jgi:hypothetical protein
VDGLSILNNIIVQRSGKIYAFMTALPSTVRINNNLLFNGTSGGTLAFVKGHGSTPKLSDLRSWTGFEATGLNAAPLFVNAAAYNLHLQPGSPAVDRGKLLAPITNGYTGSAPDIGRFELGK